MVGVSGDFVFLLAASVEDRGRINLIKPYLVDVAWERTWNKS